MMKKTVVFFIIFCLFRLNNANNITTTVDMTTTNAPQLSNNYSRIITIIYFSFYVLILFIIGFIVRLQSGIKICSKKYFKALWIQKGIYLAILIHIYDTATDIGVLIDWYYLWNNERNGFNYENIDMKVFFWCGIAALIIYKMWNLMISCIGNHHNPIIMIILSLFELSIFVFVYDSFNDIQPEMEKYYEFEKRRKELKSNTKDKISKEVALQVKTNTNNNKDNKDKIETEIEFQTETNTNSNNDNKTDNESSDAQKETSTQGMSVEELDEEMTKIIQDIKPSDGQYFIQLYEGIFESMPQVLLQSIFLLRSYNTSLSQDSNLILIITSLIASILSISTKIISFDTNNLGSEGVLAKDHGCKIKLVCIDNDCSFNGCNNWYFIRIFWRIFNILNRFIVLSLIWTVLGGIIFAIYSPFSVLYNIIIMWYIEKDMGDAFLYGTMNVLILFGLGPKYILIIITKCIDHLIILILLLLFTLTNIECNICSDICFRSLNINNNNCDINWSRNDLLLIFIISSWIVYIFDTIFTIIIIKLKPDMFVSG